MRTALAILFAAVLAGCVSKSGTTAGSGGWPYYGWSTNAGSLDPVTNRVAEPDWGPIPPPSK
ncbi:MAG: hypothetical protein A2Y38_07995 [Spirochaetes bacterium GWB1_59_5]|nr:MAG: hypothetical protein A2Y38_07995 [Spirochaetes bacterium GWB1_59_5]